MTYSIKSFLKIKKDSDYKFLIIQILRDFGGQFSYVVKCGATPQEPILIVIEEIVDFKVIDQTIGYYFFEDFRQGAKKGYRTVVITTGVVPRLKDWYCFTCFKFGGENTS